MRRILFLKKSKSLRGSSGASIEFSLLLFQPLFFGGVGDVQAVRYLDIFHKNIWKVPPLRRIRTFSAARLVSLSDELLPSPRTPGLRPGYFLLATSPA